jgi:predicted HTH transcriptional regulator
MIPQPLAELIAKGEGQTLDFKYRIDDAAKIAISLVAFANSDGGKLLIGVKDNGNIVGVTDEEEIYMIESAAQRYSKPEIKFEVTAWEVDKKIVLEVHINPSEQKPHFAKNKNNEWIAYERVNDENHKVNSIITKLWNSAGKPKKQLNYGKNEAAVMEYLRENKEITASKFCKLVKMPRFKAEKLLILLLEWGVLNYENKNGSIVFSLGNPNNPAISSQFLP